MSGKKCIFISGAASGIGLETARLFAKKGWYVGIFDINDSGLKSLQAEIGEANCFQMIMDVCNVESVRQAVGSFADKTGGKMDLLFNSAGILKFGPFENVSLEDSHKIVDVNLKGVLTCTHCALELLKTTPGARIVTMASTSAIYGVPDLLVYAATKSAICAVTEALDIELERYGIIVSDILAPYVNTPMVTNAENKAFSMERMGVKIEPSEVAGMVWKAAHGRKLHWKMGAATFLLLGIFWVMPFVRRYVVKTLTVRPEGK
ncbi:MAG: SDR family oxidoreductase [Desulfomonilaceae bacterium]